MLTEINFFSTVRTLSHFLNIFYNLLTTSSNGLLPFMDDVYIYYFAHGSIRTPPGLSCHIDYLVISLKSSTYYSVISVGVKNCKMITLSNYAFAI